MKRSPLKKKSKNETKKLIYKLVEISHNFIRKRDSISEDAIGGYCFDCGILVYGQQFQAGHFIPDSVGGALLRYHPHNMHGQSGGCNMKHSQERVKIDYTIKMQEKYGIDYVNHLRQLKYKSIKADSVFYNKMIDLYLQGDEDKIVDYIESLVL